MELHTEKVVNPVNIAVARLKHDDGIRLICTSCNESITQWEPFVTVDGFLHHDFCAADAGLTKPCPVCFMLRCDC